MNRHLRRIASAVAAAGALAVPALVLPAPAAAAPLGQVRLSQSSGSVDDNPIFATAEASGPCPTGFGADTMIRIGPVGGPYANVVKPLTAGGYDRKAPSGKPNRSFSMALGNVKPADGEWQVVVECYSITDGMHPERFVTPVTVSGTVGARCAASSPPDVSGPDQAEIDARLAANNRTGRPPSATRGRSPDSLLFFAGSGWFPLTRRSLGKPR
ncbi:hypothetical protein [Asanoa siamensis]|uniref:hypothetical protein n=1 Tax=Asanoa siamensis TaxID=926357 RepID=UPI001940F291|nr:hypothetical protein [Asanoa siamensis]